MSDLAKLYSSFMKDMEVDHIAHSSRSFPAQRYLSGTRDTGECLVPAGAATSLVDFLPGICVSACRGVCGLDSQCQACM
ncbi:hypothetical protein FQA39_LY11425 [Lamprigera yunnana]|nr:hypothetical protein FQA39_LY11425 [Lamprigera yunnana]